MARHGDPLALLGGAAGACGGRPVGLLEALLQVPPETNTEPAAIALGAAPRDDHSQDQERAQASVSQKGQQVASLMRRRG